MPLTIKLAFVALANASLFPMSKMIKTYKINNEDASCTQNKTTITETRFNKAG